MNAEFWRNWTLLGFLRWFATAVVATIGALFMASLLDENYRTLIEAHHWDSWLTRSVAAMPDLLAMQAIWLAIGVAFGVAAALWLIWAFPHRLGDHHALPKSRPAQWATAIGVLAIVGGALYLAANQAGAPPIHDPPSADEIAKATAPIQAQLETAQKTITDLRKAPAQAVPTVGAPIGPMTTLQMRDRLGTRFLKAPPNSSPIDFRWAIVITAPQSNLEFANFLDTLMKEADLQVQRLAPPDIAKNLDAPDFASAASGRLGVTLHGDDVLSKRLSDTLPPCIAAGITSKTVDGLRQWYRDRIVPEQQIIWIEIGEGSPWTMDRRCRS